MEDIVNSNEWKDFKERLKTNPPEYCKKYCGYKKNNSHEEYSFG